MSAQLKVRRHRYYAYLRKSGQVVWMTRKTHVMLLEHPTWVTNFHLQKATGESRLLTVEEYLALKRVGWAPTTLAVSPLNIPWDH